MKKYLPASQLNIARDVVRELFTVGLEDGDPLLAETKLFDTLAKRKRARKVKQKNNLRTQLQIVLSILDNHSVITRAKRIEADSFMGGQARRVSIKDVCLSRRASKFLSESLIEQEANVAPDFNRCLNNAVDDMLVFLGAMYRPAQKPAPELVAAAHGSGDQSAGNITEKERPRMGNKQKQKPTRAEARPIVQTVRPANVLSPNDGKPLATVNLDDTATALKQIAAAEEANYVTYAVNGVLQLFKSHRDAIQYTRDVPGSVVTPIDIRALKLTLKSQVDGGETATSVQTNPATKTLVPLLSVGPTLLLALSSAVKELKESVAAYNKRATAAPLDNTAVFSYGILEVEHIFHDAKILVNRALAAGEDIPEDMLLAYASDLEKQIDNIANNNGNAITYLFARNQVLKKPHRRAPFLFRIEPPEETEESEKG
jgi:hypothetical protein